MLKPHKGIIKNWVKRPIDKETEEKIKRAYADYNGLGYYIYGTCINHPQFGTSSQFHTSWVVSHNEETGEIETRNSRYTLIGPEVS